ncbi:MAG: aminotransferase class V-fold PLP-dependent enzyme [Bacteroidales bacterium]|nr:aminotransferase class V-fold PLP-dependent enzyme [Bacteroidales bacterium]
MSFIHNFASDNHAGCHPNILEAIAQCNNGHVKAYGDDEYTQKAITLLQEIFETNGEIIFTYNGTASNVLSIALCCQSFEAVLCAETAHINTDECGALEKFVGCKIIPINTTDGKISIKDLEQFLFMKGNVHHNQPRVISISQPTELGTIYTVEEIKELTSWVHKHDMYIHIDGARIANATVSLATPISNFTTHIGVDVVTFGGSKNGMLFGEAIIILNRNLEGRIKYFQKQGMQLLSKMRYIGAQYIAYLQDDLWLKNANHANQMARLLEKNVYGIPHIDIAQKVQSNSVFARIPNTIVEPLQNFSYFYKWEEKHTHYNNDQLVRWMCSFNTQKEHVLDFTATIKKLIEQHEKENH